MKSTGMVRKVDQLGRVVVPIELRRSLDIKEFDPLEIFVEDDLILMKKFQANNACIITGDILNENKEYAPGLILSPRGAEILLEEIENKK